MLLKQKAVTVIEKYVEVFYSHIFTSKICKNIITKILGTKVE